MTTTDIIRIILGVWGGMAMLMTSRNAVERVLHDQYYARVELEEAELRKASESDRLRLYRDNPDRGFSPKQYQLWLLGDLSGKDVCDYACGDGADSVLLVANGAASVRAFDISRSAVDIARRRAAACGIASKVTASEDNAEHLSYESATFDAVYGSSVLHHLDIERAAHEVYRVLKPGGHAVFREPFQQSRALAAMAKVVFAVTPLTPDAVSPQRQLTQDDIRLLKSIFPVVNVKAFGIFNRLDRVIAVPGVTCRLSRLDAKLLGLFPALSAFSRHVVIELIK